MRIVLDTNVLISAILKANSIPAAAVRQACSVHVLLTSVAVQQELHRILCKPYFQRFVSEEVLRKIDTMFAASELVIVTESIKACRDPMDDKFLELAVTGKADIIISGDKDLLSMTSYEGTRIITPAEFLITLHS